MMSYAKRKVGSFWGSIAFALFAQTIGACKFTAIPKAPPRIAAGDTLIIPESVIFERSAAGDSIVLNFETRSAAQCKLGFYPINSTSKSSPSFTPCVGRSATKFSETITGIPKDQLVTVVIMSWSATADENTARGLVIAEKPPSADQLSINLLSVDLGGGRLEFSSIDITDPPTSALSSALGKAQDGGCALNQSSRGAISSSRKPVPILSATSRGFITSTISKNSDVIAGGSFQSIQRQSTEWSITARTSAGFGQLRIARPALLKSVTFAGRDQSSADDDGLEDVDPPALKVTPTQTFVATWSIDGDGKDAMATLTIAPSGAFKGITCTARAAAGKITIPSDLMAKIPAGERLWAVLRLDSWQALDDSRWLVRVSDWKSLGVQRL